MPSFSSFRRSKNIGSARSRGPLSSEPELPLGSSIAEPVYASSISARSICTIEKDNALNSFGLDNSLIVSRPIHSEDYLRSSALLDCSYTTANKSSRTSFHLFQCHHQHWVKFSVMRNKVVEINTL